MKRNILLVTMLLLLPLQAVAEEFEYRSLFAEENEKDLPEGSIGGTGDNGLKLPDYDGRTLQKYEMDVYEESRRDQEIEAELRDLDALDAERVNPAEADLPTEFGYDPDAREPRRKGVVKIERRNGVEKITLENGDVILNMPGKHTRNSAKTMQELFESKQNKRNAPIRKSQEWTRLPANK